MQFLKFTATLTDKEWIKGNKDRETYRDYKAEQPLWMLPFFVRLFFLLSFIC